MNKKKVYITGHASLVGTKKSDKGNYYLIDDSAYEHLLKNKNTRHVDRISQFSLATASVALENRGLKIDESNCQTIGLILGTEYGPLLSTHDFDMESVTKGAAFVNPGHFPNTVLNSPSCQTVLQLSITGPTYTLYNGLNSGLDTIGLAYNTIQAGWSSCVVAGGADEINELQLSMHQPVNPLYESCGYLILEEGNAIKGGIEIINYDSFFAPECEADAICQSTKDHIHKLINQSEIAIDQVKCIDVCTRCCIDFRESIQTQLGSLIQYRGGWNIHDTDWLGASGIIQLISWKNSNKTESNSYSIFLNICNTQISILLVKLI